MDFIEVQAVYNKLSQLPKDKLIQLQFQWKNPENSEFQLNVRVYFIPRSFSPTLQLILSTQEQDFLLDYGMYKNEKNEICINPYIENQKQFKLLSPYLLYKQSLQYFFDELIQQILSIEPEIFSLEDEWENLKRRRRQAISNYPRKNQNIYYYCITRLSRGKMSTKQEQKAKQLFGFLITERVKENGYTFRFVDDPLKERELILNF